MIWSSKLRYSRRATDQPTSLIAAIAHELSKIRGSNEADLCLKARQILTEAFRSIEHAAQGSMQGEPFVDRRPTEVEQE